MEFGKALDPPRIAAVLLVANAIVNDEVEEHGKHAHPEHMPFRHGSDEGTELQIYNSGQVSGGMTWGQMQKVVQALWLYLVDGERSKSCHFDIFAAVTPSIYEHIGWGNIVEATVPPSKPVVEVGPGNATHKRSRDLSRRLSMFQSTRAVDPDIVNSTLMNSSVLNSSPLNLTAAPFRFRVPNTKLTLSVSVRSEPIGFETIETLIEAKSEIRDEINTNGASSAIPDASFRCELDSEGIFLEIDSWRPPPDGLTWSQLAEAIEGLGLFYLASHRQGCLFDVLYGDYEVMIGFGRIAKWEGMS